MHHTFQGLTSVKSLLLLHEEEVAGDGDTADVLAMGGVGPWNALIAREVRSIVATNSSLLDARDLGNDLCGPLISVHEGGRALHGARVDTDGAERFLRSLEGVSNGVGSRGHWEQEDALHNRHTSHYIPDLSGGERTLT